MPLDRPAPDVAPPPVESQEEAEPAAAEPTVEEVLLVEEVSIDGMCGVY